MSWLLEGDWNLANEMGFGKLLHLAAGLVLVSTAICAGFSL